MDDDAGLRADYGVDAPTLVAGLLIGGFAAILMGLIFYVFGDHLPRALVISVFVSGVAAGSLMLIGAALTLWGSRFGKRIIVKRLIRSLHLQGHETVLDAGCGRGLLLIEAAKYLKSGKAIGVDLWLSRDQSGNTAEAALANARAEDVAERVAVKTADMRAMPIQDESVDVVVSSLAIHNIPTGEGRVRAIKEISRVLRPGGRLALMDLAHSKKYLSTLKRLGWSQVERSGPIFLFWPPVRVVHGTKPEGFEG